mmetsp:Transcript_6024/g.10675  ORF Transcript_6024/g.10675 Transcript_6024/m.10675 type:complete len:243 (+) Transcript_6024:14-742(+)
MGHLKNTQGFIKLKDSSIFTLSLRIESLWGVACVPATMHGRCRVAFFVDVGERTLGNTCTVLWLAIYYKQFPLASLHTFLILETSMPPVFGCIGAAPPMNAFVSFSTALPSFFALLVTTCVFWSTFFITTLVFLSTFFMTFLDSLVAFFTSKFSFLVTGLVFWATARSIFLACFDRTRSMLATSLFRELKPAWSCCPADVSVATATEGALIRKAATHADCRNDARLLPPTVVPVLRVGGPTP